jgi:hypothetical protein
MPYINNIYLSALSLNSDCDPFFEENYFHHIELDGELIQFMDMTDLNEMDESLWKEI